MRQCTESVNLWQQYEWDEKLSFIETLSNHQVLSFDPSKDQLMHNYGSLEDFLRKYFSINILQKIGLYNQMQFNLYRETHIPCVILDPTVFTFIVGKNRSAVTVNKHNDDFKRELGLILGFNPGLFMKTQFVLIRSNRNKRFNILDLVHEATHVTQNFSNRQSKDENYMENIQEIEAFMNEILAFKYLKPNSNFSAYIQYKELHFNSKIPLTQHGYLNKIWDEVNGFEWWDMTPYRKQKIIHGVFK